MDDTTSGATPPAPPPPPPLPPPPLPGGPGHSGGPGQPGGPGRSGHAPHTGLDRFFNAIRGFGLRRSPHRFIGGVCGGIAERTGVDVTVVRVLAVILGFFGGIGLLLYALAWLLLPEPDGRIHAEQVLHGDVHAGAVGAIILTVCSFGGTGAGPGRWFAWGWGGGWGGGIGNLWRLTSSVVFFGVIVFVVWMVSQARGGSASHPSAPPAPMSPFTASRPSASSAPVPPYAGGATYAGSSYGDPATMTAPVPPAPPGATSADAATGLPTPPSTPRSPRRPSFGGFGSLAVGGLAIIGAAVTVLVMRHHAHHASTAVMAWAVALGVLAAALVIGGIVGRRAGLVGLFAVVAVIGTLGAVVTPRMNHVQAVGERTWTPTAGSDASGGYGLAIGDATLDLTRLDVASLAGRTTPLHIPVSVAIGQLTVRVPPDLSVHVASSAAAGTITNNFNDFTPDASTSGQAVVGGTDNPDELDGVGITGSASNGTGTAGSDHPLVVIDAKVGFGEVDVYEVSR